MLIASNSRFSCPKILEAVTLLQLETCEEIINLAGEGVKVCTAVEVKEYQEMKQSDLRG